MKWLDAFLDRITMYRLLLYYLIALVIVACGLSAVGALHMRPFDIAFSAVFLTAGCWLSNKVIAWFLDVPSNPESSLITALILALIITPTSKPDMLVFLAAASGLAMASKYLLAYNRRHIFNPAAIAVVLTNFGAHDAASWWIGTAVMLPAVLIGGVLVTRRIRRTAMVLWYVTAALAGVALLAALRRHGDPLNAIQKEVFSSAMLFMGFVMLTEPLTSPTTKTKQKWYGALVGALMPPQLHIGGLYSTPELALVAGNILNFIVTPRTKVSLRLKERVQLTPDSYDFVFEPSQAFTYRPGQCMEFTLPHGGMDVRGARRFFTLASSPTEPDVHVGVKFYDPSSTFKEALRDMDARPTMLAGQLGGDFTLPKDPARKLVFIAGGIGITPFRSMLKYLVDTGQKRDIVVLYSARTTQDVAYRDVLEQARQQLGVQVLYLVSDQGVRPPFYATQLNATVIQSLVPDYGERLFYISGPHGMVVAAGNALHGLGVSGRHVKKDFFSGYA